VIKFCPVTNNYDRVHEGESFPMRLIGEDSSGTTFKDALKGLLYSNDTFGKCFIRFCDPIDIKEYTHKWCSD
jgi:glycerol-3-phosphate O-acyltransferase